MLRWILEHGDEGSGCLSFGSTKPFAGIPVLTESQVAEAIKRLAEHGLVTGIGPVVTNARLRLLPTANGLRVLGGWPPVQGATLTNALVLILRELAGRDELTGRQDSGQERLPLRASLARSCSRWSKRGSNASSLGTPPSATRPRAVGIAGGRSFQRDARRRS